MVAEVSPTCINRCWGRSTLQWIVLQLMLAQKAEAQATWPLFGQGGSCSKDSAYLGHVDTASPDVCETACQGQSNCVYYCVGTRTDGKGQCYKYSECPSLVDTSGLHGSYKCYVRQATWPLFGQSGSCSLDSAYLGNVRTASPDICETSCQGQSNCEYFCVGTRTDGQGHCYKYSECPSLVDPSGLHGSYRCYARQATTTVQTTTTYSPIPGTCGAYSCPTGYVNQNLESTTQTDSNCCQEACGAFTCPTGYGKQNEASTLLTEANCCAQPCTAANAKQVCSELQVCDLRSCQTCFCQAADAVDCTQSPGYFHDRNAKLACTSYLPRSYCHGGGTPCLAGADLVGQAFDFTTQSLADLPTNTRKFPYKFVGQYTSITLKGKSYRVPPGVTALEDSASSGVSSSVTFESSAAIQAELSRSSGVEGSYGVVGSASASAKYDTSDSATLQRGSTISHQAYETRLYTAKLGSTIVAGPGFTDLLKTLPVPYAKDDPSKVSLWSSFIEFFGTHYVVSVTMGARLTLSLEMSSCALTSCKSELVEVEACANGRKGLVSAEVCAEQASKTSECKSQYASSTTSETLVFGGDGQTCSASSCDYNLWRDSVTIDAGSLKPVKVQTRELWTLVAPGTDIADWRAPLKEALEHYVESKKKAEVQVTQSSCQQTPPADEQANFAKIALPGIWGLLWIQMRF